MAKVATRKFDHLGRIVIPKYIRDRLDMKQEEQFWVSLDENKIIIERVEDCCCICNAAIVESGKVIKLSSKYVCLQCMKELKDIE